MMGSRCAANSSYEWISPRQIFFIFVVRRYSGECASTRAGNSLCGRRLRGGGGAIFAEYRLGGGTEFARREALFGSESRVEN